jgi:deoxyribonuclease-1-like protein
MAVARTLPREGPVKRLLLLIVPVALVAGGWWFFQHYRIEGLDQVHIRPRDAVGWVANGARDDVPPARGGETIKIASFNIQVFGESKLAKAPVMKILAEVVRRFDVIAIQEVRSAQQDVLPRFVEMVNAEGAHYDFVLGPRLGRTSSKEQYAFIFDRARLVLDPQSVYTVDDPDDRLHREPLVAGFSVRGPPPSEAFTFTLVNIHTDPDEVQAELAALDDVFRAVRDDGRHEDDIILLGDLNADDQHLGELGTVPYLTVAISGKPSNTRGTKLYDNILFDSRASTEFTRRAGVFDLLREFNLTLAEALEVSDHLPVWAEFSAREGGVPGRLATLPGEATK